MAEEGQEEAASAAPVEGQGDDEGPACLGGHFGDEAAATGNEPQALVKSRTILMAL